jgi:hypothetical protein
MIMRTRTHAADSLKNNHPSALISQSIKVQADSREVLEQYYRGKIDECYYRLQTLNIHDHPKEITSLCLQVLEIRKELKRMSRMGY